MNVSDLWTIKITDKTIYNKLISMYDSNTKINYNSTLLYNSIKFGNKKEEENCFNNKVLPDNDCLILYIMNYNTQMITFCKSIGMKIDEYIIKSSFDNMKIFGPVNRILLNIFIQFLHNILIINIVVIIIIKLILL
jgi:hypothetical protein